MKFDIHVVLLTAAVLLQRPRSVNEQVLQRALALEASSSETGSAVGGESAPALLENNTLIKWSVAFAPALSRCNNRMLMNVLPQQLAGRLPNMGCFLATLLRSESNYSALAHSRALRQDLPFAS